MPTFHFLSTPQLQISCILFSVSQHYIKLAAGYVHLLHAATTTKSYNSPLFQVQYLPAKLKGAFCKEASENQKPSPHGGSVLPEGFHVADQPNLH